jgi:hypothetical protein
MQVITIGDRREVLFSQKVNLFQLKTYKIININKLNPMIEIDKLHKFLNRDSKHREKEYAFRIPEKEFESGHIYGKYILDAKFSMIGKRFIDLPEWVNFGDEAPQLQYISEKLVPKNTFTSAILNSIMPEYRFFDLKTKLTFCSDLHRQIGYDMEQNSLYKDMGYARLRKEIREKFINADDLDNDEKLKQIIIDYFSLTVYEISKTKQEKFGRNMEISRKGFVPLVWRKTDKNEEYLDKNISCFLLRLEDKYYSIVKRNTSGLFDFSVRLPDDIEISVPQEEESELEPISEPLIVKSPTKVLEKKKVSKKNEPEIIIKKQEDSKEEPQKEPESEPEPESEQSRKIFIPKKITLKEIQDLAIQRDIPIQKKSEKTGKMLNKTIEELREDILGK